MLEVEAVPQSCIPYVQTGQSTQHDHRICLLLSWAPSKSFRDGPNSTKSLLCRIHLLPSEPSTCVPEPIIVLTLLQWPPCRTNSFRELGSKLGCRSILWVTVRNIHTSSSHVVSKLTKFATSRHVYSLPLTLVCLISSLRQGSSVCRTRRKAQETNYGAEHYSRGHQL
jgi:hypothetical protein